MMASSAGRPLQGQAAAIPTRDLASSQFYPASGQPYTTSASEQQDPAPAREAGKPPLPPKTKKQRHLSDSELSEISDGDQGSDFVVERNSRGEFDDDFENDFSDDSSSRKRGRKGEEDGSRKRRKTPEDNEMRRKLRGNTPQESSQQQSAEGEGPSETEEEEDPFAIPERVVSPEKEASQKAQLKTSWELIAILDFLSTFQPYLKLEHLQFGAEELESALVLNNGTSGLLPELHIGLMKGISTRSSFNQSSWATSLAERLKHHWRTGHLSGAPPFISQRRHEAATYATLPLENRVRALRILCELRLDKEDLHNVVEYALNPPKKTKTERKAIAAALKAGKPLPPEPVMPTMAEMRREPLAKDSSGLMYWYLDYHTTTGTRMYREMPDSLLKAKLKKEQSEPVWELVASSLEELTDLGEKLGRSKKKPDQALATTILEEIIPELMERREADLRKQRAAAKVQSQLNNILPDEGGYGGRSRRARKTVNYSFDAYDAAIRAALRGGGNQDEADGRATRSQAFLEPRMTAEEEALLGLRRGRSAHAPEPGLELPPFKRAKLSSAAASAEPTPNATAEPTPEPTAAASTDPSVDVVPPSQSPEPSGAERLLVRMPAGDSPPPNARAGSRHESTDPYGTGQESVEVEISELESRDGLYNGGSLEAENEEISSLSEKGDLDYEDNPDDADWC